MTVTQFELIGSSLSPTSQQLLQTEIHDYVQPVTASWALCKNSNHCKQGWRASKIILILRTQILSMHLHFTDIDVQDSVAHSPSPGFVYKELVLFVLCLVTLQWFFCYKHLQSVTVTMFFLKLQTLVSQVQKRIKTILPQRTWPSRSYTPPSSYWKLETR